jgi:chromosome segregation ATPase
MELKVETLEQYLANMNAQLVSAEGQVKRAERSLNDAEIQLYRGQGSIDAIRTLLQQAKDEEAKAQAEEA